VSTLLTQVFKPVLAQTPFNKKLFGNINPPPGVSKYSGTAGEGLFVFLNNLMKLIIVVAGLFALFNFIIAGYDYINAGGDSQKVSKAWEKIWQSLVGLLIAAGSFTLAAVFGKLIFGDWGAILTPKIYGP